MILYGFSAAKYEAYCAVKPSTCCIVQPQLPDLRLMLKYFDTERRNECGELSWDSRTLEPEGPKGRVGSVPTQICRLRQATPPSASSRRWAGMPLLAY